MIPFTFPHSIFNLIGDQPLSCALSMLSCHFCVAYGTESISSIPRYVPGWSHCCCACCCVCWGVISRSRFPLRAVKSRGEIGLAFTGSGAMVRQVFVFVGKALIGSAGLYHCGAGGVAFDFLPGLFPNTIQFPAICFSGLGNLIPAA